MNKEAYEIKMYVFSLDQAQGKEISIQKLRKNLLKS